MAVLAVGFSFPQAFAAPIDNVLSIVKDIQAKVNSGTFGLQATKNAVDGISTKLDVPGRVVTFNNLQLDLAENEGYEILPVDDVGHGIYVDIVVSGVEVGESLILLCDDDEGGGGGAGLPNGEHTLDRSCDGLSFQTGFGPVTATINGKIRYTNEYISAHDANAP